MSKHLARPDNIHPSWDYRDSTPPCPSTHSDELALGGVEDLDAKVPVPSSGSSSALASIFNGQHGTSLRVVRDDVAAALQPGRTTR